jgi:hypothetical protein
MTSSSPQLDFMSTQEEWSATMELDLEAEQAKQAKLDFKAQQAAKKEAKLAAVQHKHMYGDFQAKYNAKEVDQYYACSDVQMALLYMVELFMQPTIQAKFAGVYINQVLRPVERESNPSITDLHVSATKIAALFSSERLTTPLEDFRSQWLDMNKTGHILNPLGVTQERLLLELTPSAVMDAFQMRKMVAGVAVPAFYILELKNGEVLASFTRFLVSQPQG